jgi:hypothetical protein
LKEHVKGLGQSNSDVLGFSKVVRSEPKN